MTDVQHRRLEPIDLATVPRFAEIATFMRTPRTDELDIVDIGMFGVPFDLGTNYRSGTREGPSAMREASRIIRRVNPTTGIAPFEVANVADVGDAPINPYKFDESIDGIRDFVANLREHGVKPLGAGGDHTITLPILRGLYDGTPLGVIQFDSHADVLDELYGTKVNHATIMRRAHEEGIIDPSRVIQIGLRGTRWSAADIDYGREAGFAAVTYDEYEEMGRAAAIELIRTVVGDGPTYITYDIDGLDPTEAPGTSGKEPGGFSMRDSQVILRSLTGLNIVGGDVNEVFPMLDPTGITSVNAVNLMFEILCLIAAAPQ